MSAISCSRYTFSSLSSIRLCSSTTVFSVISRSSSISDSALIRRASSPGISTFLIAPVCGSGAASDTLVTICAIFPVCVYGSVTSDSKESDPEFSVLTGSAFDVSASVNSVFLASEKRASSDFISFRNLSMSVCPAVSIWTDKFCSGAGASAATKFFAAISALPGFSFAASL